MAKKIMLKKLFQKENTLIFLVLLGLILGNILFFSASIVKSLNETKSSFTYWKQFFLRTTILGIIAFFLGFIIGYFWPKTKFLISLIFICLIILLVVTLIFKQGPKRWIKIGEFSFQPSEIIKPFLLLFVSSLAAGIKKTFGFSFHRLIAFWLPVILVIVLVFLQPALSNAVIIFVSSLAVYLMLKPTLKEFLVICLIFVLIVSSAFLWQYRVERFFAFLNPQSNPEKSLQAKLAQNAISQGGFWGVGIGNSVYKVIGIPAMLNDSIIAIIGEEIGFLGLAALYIFFLYLFIYLLKLGEKIELVEGKAFVYGVSIWFAFQTFLHLAGNLGIIPLTGIVLPFFSYGGSAQIAILLSFGIIKGLYEKWG